MPELPEVELVSSTLQKLVAGRKLTNTEVRREKLIPENDADDFVRRLSNVSITAVARRGKHILISLDSEETLLVHLRMTGRFLLLGLDRELPKHSHAVFTFADSDRLVFEDQRHFGFMRLLANPELSTCGQLASLAPEPLSDEFSISYFRSVLLNSKRSIKELLLDQTKVCGVGNIYASESLFLANIDPQQKAGQITKPQSQRLLSAIKSVLGNAVNRSLDSEVDPENIDGSYFSGDHDGRWMVYDRENETCPDCPGVISRIVQGGRSTYFCKKCQRTRKARKV